MVISYCRKGIASSSLMVMKVLVLLSLLLMVAGSALALEDEGKKDDLATGGHNEEANKQQIPEQVTIENWACKEIADLGKKYSAEKKLPDAVTVEGKPCPKSELTQCLISILDKVVETCGKEGTEAIPREDLDRLAVLHEALKTELAQDEGYITIRETIEKIPGQA